MCVCQRVHVYEWGMSLLVLIKRQCPQAEPDPTCGLQICGFQNNCVCVHVCVCAHACVCVCVHVHACVRVCEFHE